MTYCPPVIVDPPEMTVSAQRSFDWFSAAAIGTWLVCAVWPSGRILAGEFAPRPAAVYLVAFALFGAAMLYIMVLPRRRATLGRAVPVAMAVVESLAAVAMNALTARYIGGTGAGIGLLVIVAAQLPYLLAGPIIWIWVGIQTTVLTLLFVPGNPSDALTLGLATGGFQMFAAASSFLAISEGRARSNLARANAELHATRSLLAESSRTAERVRISRDLHDTLGHHLTALSLQLDVAARLSEGQAADHIHKAHAITKLLLSDVRDVVSTLRGTSRLDLADMLRALAAQPAGAQIHLELPESLTVEDSGRAEAIVRAVQEIITNTTRHAGARNLWLRLEASAAGITLQTRDDGRGAESVAWGNGLRGMRERFEEFGGRVDVTSGVGSGFEVRAVMPLSPAA